ASGNVTAIEGVAGDPERVVFTLSSNASGGFTFELNDQVDHPVASEGGEAPGDLELLDLNLSGAIEAFDADGDSVVLDTAVTVQIEDDTPIVDSMQNATVQLDDDALTGGNAGGTGDIDPDAANLTGTLNFSAGADGVASILLLDTGAPAGFTYSLNDDDTVLTITQSVGIDGSATDVLSLTLDDTTSGAYTVEQLAAISHPDDAENFENNLNFNASYQVTDRDGDTADGTLAINVDDDTPVVDSTQNALAQLDDDAFAGNAGGTGDDADSVDVTGTLNFSAGADGVESVLLTGTTPLPAGFTSTVSAGGTLLTITQTVGVDGTETAVLTVTLDNMTSGDYTVAQLAAIAHPDGLDENNLDFTATYQVSDRDGDTADGTLSINVDDDTPVANDGISVTGLVHEDALSGANAES
ncbi:DUF5801 repeats-in-toxin domain-containing protein, partial [Halopseudomonas sp.]|uniref:DUF5801 repeats-in-toxin domain-containing protein n=1 Tax=Halopseudomonas sp. TaxID=2901191 RepID=UPI0030019000